MSPFNRRLLLVCSIAAVAAAPVARAQWAVIDAPAIVQLLQQVQTMEQQLQTARAQLQQAQQALTSMTGGRGMEQLLSGTARNYLPADWAQLTSVLQGAGGGYAGLAAEVRRAMDAHAVLSPQRLADLSPVSRQQIQTARQWSAMQQALAQEALANVSGRFASIQNLIAAIPAAADQKAILDLQARISAELGMLQNEQTKLQVFRQAMQAQEALDRQQQREQVIAAHGRFETRFQPVP